MPHNEDMPANASALVSEKFYLQDLVLDAERDAQFSDAEAYARRIVEIDALLVAS